MCLTNTLTGVKNTFAIYPFATNYFPFPAVDAYGSALPWPCLTLASARSAN